MEKSIVLKLLNLVQPVGPFWWSLNSLPACRTSPSSRQENSSKNEIVSMFYRRLTGTRLLVALLSCWTLRLNEKEDMVQERERFLEKEGVPIIFVLA